MKLRDVHLRLQRIPAPLMMLLTVLLAAGFALSACQSPGSDGNDASVGDSSLTTIRFAAPTQALAIREDAQAGTVVGVVAASINRHGAAILFAIEDDPHFAIDSSAGTISLKPGAKLDFESASQHEVTVVARALEVEEASTVLQIAVLDVQQTIVFDAAAQTLILPEDAPPGSIAGAIQADLQASVHDEKTTNGDANNGLYSNIGLHFSVVEHPYFSIDAHSGEVFLRAGVSLDHEHASSHELTVRIDAQEAVAPVEGTVVIAVENVLERRIIFEDDTLYLQEGIPDYLIVGQLTASVIGGGAVTFATADNPLFAVTAEGSVILRRGASLDYETASQHSLTITASAADAATVQATLSIHVHDIPETIHLPDPAPLFIVHQDLLPEQIIGTVRAFIGGGRQLEFNTEHDLFAIDARNGNLSLKPGQRLEQNFNSEHSFAVQIGAIGIPSITVPVTVRVEEARILAETEQHFTVFEGTSPGSIFAHIAASAKDGAPLTFQMKTHLVLAVEAHSGGLMVKEGSDLDHTGVDHYQFAVTVSVPGALPLVIQVIVEVGERQLGTVNHPYLVDSLDELQSIATGFQNESLPSPLSLEESLSAHYLQIGDIDASPTAGDTWSPPGHQAGAGFLSIGADDQAPFRGQYDGAGYRIEGLHIGPLTGASALFGQARDGALLKNIVIAAPAHIASFPRKYSGLFVGSLVGQLQKSTVTNAFSEADVNEGTFTGGLVGYNNEGEISHSAATGDVNTRHGTHGGLVGFSVEGTIHNSFASGNVKQIISGNFLEAGGLVGIASGKITHSYATGDIHGPNVGGLVGQNSADIHHSYATGDVYGTHVAGGLAGISISNIHDSFASGNVRGGIFAGGLVGSNRLGSIRRSFALGEVSGTWYVGGLVGRNEKGWVHHSFAVGNVHGERLVGGLVGYNTPPLGFTPVTPRPPALIEHSFALGEVVVQPVEDETGYGGGLVGYSRASLQANLYAVGSVFCEGSCVVGGVVGRTEGSDWQNSYFRTDAYPDGTVPSLAGEDDGQGSLTGDGLTLAELRGASCSTDSLFVWDHDGDGFQDSDGDGYWNHDDDVFTPEVAVTAALGCAGLAAFPWNFGDDGQLPALSGSIGGVFDAAQQHSLVASVGDEHFQEMSLPASYPSEAVGVEVALSLPSALALEVDAHEAVGHRLEYRWLPSVQSGWQVIVGVTQPALVMFIAAPGTYTARVIVLVYDASDRVVEGYTTQVGLHVTEEDEGEPGD